MRNRLFFFVSSIILCFSFVSAQDKTSENRFEVSLIIEKPEIVWTAKTANIKIKITNLTNAPIDGPNLTIYVEKERDGRVDRWNKTEAAHVPFPANVIEQGKSTAFDVDLKKLGWIENLSSSYVELNSKKDLYSPLLIGWYYVFVTVGECVKIDNVPNVLLDSEYLSCDSEKVLVNFKPFDFK